MEGNEDGPFFSSHLKVLKFLNDDRAIIKAHMRGEREGEGERVLHHRVDCHNMFHLSIGNGSQNGSKRR
jgi:hypothetical protein